MMNLPASVGEDGAASSLEGLDSVVPLQSCPDLLAARCDEEVGLRLQASSSSLLDNVLRALHVLVRTVCAAADQTSTKGLRPALLLNDRLELGQRCGEVRGEGSVDVRLEGGKVDLNDLIIGGFGIGLQKVALHWGLSNLQCSFGNRSTVCCLQVGNVSLREREQRGCSANFRTKIDVSIQTV